MEEVALDYLLTAKHFRTIRARLSITIFEPRGIIVFRRAPEALAQMSVKEF